MPELLVDFITSLDGYTAAGAGGSHPIPTGGRALAPRSVRRPACRSENPRRPEPRESARSRRAPRRRMRRPPRDRRPRTWPHRRPRRDRRPRRLASRAGASLAWRHTHQREPQKPHRERRSNAQCAPAVPLRAQHRTQRLGIEAPPCTQLVELFEQHHRGADDERVRAARAAEERRTVERATASGAATRRPGGRREDTTAGSRPSPLLSGSTRTSCLPPGSRISGFTDRRNPVAEWACPKRTGSGGAAARDLPQERLNLLRSFAIL